MSLAGAHPIMSCADAQAWEHDYFSGDEAKEWAAMSRAGRAVAAATLEDAREIGGIPEGGRILVLCGKGHNGGDALIALHAMLAARIRATALVLIVPDFSALRPLVRRALEDLWRAHRTAVEFCVVSGPPDGADARCVRDRLSRESFDVCLDGLFGLQFRPPFRAPANWLVPLVNDAARIRLRVAVDLPSGVADASDAQPFRADFTYAAGVVKAPVFSSETRSAVGRVRYLDLGFFSGGRRRKEAGVTEEAAADSLLASAAKEPATASFILTSHVLDPLRESRDAHADKRTFGHLFVVSGSRTMPGAVLMTVESALVSGVGLVTAFVPESLAPAFAARLPEAMWVPMPETLEGGLALEGRGTVVARAARCTALLAGPGLGRDRESLALITELLRAIDVPAVLDGDALQPGVVTAHYPGSEAVKVLTPHAGEFARIAGAKVGDDASLRETATRLRAAIALKGAPTRVCDGGAVYYSPFGGPVLSRGGSGDVLAGLVAGQLAQGASPLEAAARGVVWHGRAADRLAREHGQASARVTELVPHLSAVLQDRVLAGLVDSGPASARPATGERAR